MFDKQILAFYYARKWVWELGKYRTNSSLFSVIVLSNRNWNSISKLYISNVDWSSSSGKLLTETSSKKSSDEFFEGIVTEYLDQRPLIAFLGNFCYWEFRGKQRYLGHFFQKTLKKTCTRCGPWPWCTNLNDSFERRRFWIRRKNIVSPYCSFNF